MENISESKKDVFKKLNSFLFNVMIFNEVKT